MPINAHVTLHENAVRLIKASAYDTVQEEVKTCLFYNNVAVCT